MSDDRLLQEIYADDPWKVVVSCILLNCTTRVQVDKIRSELFRKFPDAASIAWCTQEEWRDLCDMLKVLGFGKTRPDKLFTFCHQWLEALKMYTVDIRMLEMSFMGVGEYARDSYKIFVMDCPMTPDEVSDKELKKYLARKHADEWSRSLDDAGAPSE